MKHKNRIYNAFDILVLSDDFMWFDERGKKESDPQKWVWELLGLEMWLPE